MRSARDMAVVYRGLLSELNVEDAALVGLGFGGWIAAEMASMAPADPSQLVLVGAMGIKPPQGDILDLAITGYIDYARAGFHDQQAFDRVYGAEPSADQLEMWDICREMSFRIAWKPYMYSQTMPHLLGAVRDAGACRMGRRRQGRADQRRQAIRRGAAERQAGNRRRPAAIASTWRSPTRSPGSSPISSVGSNRHAPDVFHRAADVGLSGTGWPRLWRHRADVPEHATSIRSPARGSTTTTSSNTCWPRRSASTASC